MAERRGVERQLIVVLAAIAFVAVAGVLAILPYRLYSRDIGQASTDAHRLSSIVHTALSHALIEESSSPEMITDLVNRFQGIAGLQIRLRQLEDGELHPAATSGRGSSTRRDTDLTYVSPPIIDSRGRTWLASMYFDLSPMKQRSIRLIVDLVLTVALGSLLFSAVIFLLARRALLGPIKSITRQINKIADGGGASGEAIEMPEFDTIEMHELTQAIERVCRAKTQ